MAWWLYDGPTKIFKAWGIFYLKIWHAFSVPFIFKTLFLPWKKDLLSDRDLPLNERFQVWTLNLVARMFGFTMRSLAVFAWGICEILLTGAMLTFLIFWFGFPAISVILIYWGLTQ